MTGAANPALRFRAPVGTTIHDRIVAAAIHLTSTAGWGAVTMGRLADLTGVSRQTVYNDVGAKPALAEAMVRSELATFMDYVTDAFARNPTDVVAAIRAAVEDTLTAARTNPLLHAVVSAAHGVETDLLPLLTTRADTVIDTASAVIHDLVARYDLPLSAGELDAAVDLIVRAVLSHVMQPGESPARTADAIALATTAMFRLPAG